MSRPAGKQDADNVLRVLSLNVWGLRFISKDRPVRIKAIAEYLAASTYDVVCLQEIWIYKEFELVRDEVVERLPFARFFHTGALGSGLAIFTRFPLIHARALPYALSGTPQKPFDGDFFVNKAAGCVVILHPVLGEVEVWTTHMHAAGEHPPDTRQAHRIAQAWQLANQIRSGAARGRYIIVTGDFNSQPQSIPIAIMRSHASLSDSFLENHPGADSPGPSTPAAALATFGMTCDSPLNTYSHGKPIKEHILAQGGKRLDYIFYRQPEPARRIPLIWGSRDWGDVDGQANGSDLIHGGGGGNGDARDQWRMEARAETAPVLRCVSSEVVLTETVPGRHFSYSDHFGVFSTFRIDTPSSGSSSRASTSHNLDPTTRPSTVASSNSATALMPRVSDASSGTLKHGASTSISHPWPDTASPDVPRTFAALTGASKSTIIRTAISTLSAYEVISKREARFHLRLCAGALVVLLGLTIGSAWQPKSYIQPIFTLLGGVLGAGAATMLYFGFLWGRWEEGLLREVKAEMELELRVLELEERGAKRGSR